MEMSNTMGWILAGAAMGFVVGLVPLIVGIIKKNVRLGGLGLLSSIVGGTLLGLLLAVPVGAVFTWLIIRKPR
jgi:hypothetical protein